MGADRKAGPRPDRQYYQAPQPVGGVVHTVAPDGRKPDGSSTFSLIALDAATGRHLWTHRSARGMFDRMGAPLVRRGTVYVDTGDGTRPIVAVDTRTHATRWVLRGSATSQEWGGEPFWTGPRCTSRRAPGSWRCRWAPGGAGGRAPTSADTGQTAGPGPVPAPVSGGPVPRAPGAEARGRTARPARSGMEAGWAGVSGPVRGSVSVPRRVRARGRRGRRAVRRAGRRWCRGAWWPGSAPRTGPSPHWGGP